ncbi:MAG: transposase, partial [Gammaproteobacteria bacterium]|nr:transposase [Gammaproteobacteria bacterium]
MQLRFCRILWHDHWAPYYRYDCSRAFEQDQQVWANAMKQLLESINQTVQDAGGALDTSEAEMYRQQYRDLLEKADRDCPPPDPPPGTPKRGRVKRSKSRNLLERLIDYAVDVLRFMENPIMPFTNNRAENVIRMTKVQQKISGCFRSKDGADAFCRIRGYITTCRQHGMSASQAMTLVF